MPLPCKKAKRLRGLSKYLSILPPSKPQHKHSDENLDKPKWLQILGVSLPPAAPTRTPRLKLYRSLGMAER